MKREGRMRTKVVLLCLLIVVFAIAIHNAQPMIVITDAIYNNRVAYRDSTSTFPDTLEALRLVGYNPNIESVDTIIYWVTVSGIGTNVVVRVEGSPDGAYNGAWTNMASTDVNLTLTANGTYGMLYSKCGGIRYTRFLTVSNSGGTPVAEVWVTGG